MADTIKPAFALSRRALLTAGGFTLFAGAIPGRAAPGLGLDGLYVEPWLAPSSGSLANDFAEAVRAGKSFAMIWELRGCPWCKRMHLETFAKPDIADYLAANFLMVRLNIQGQRPIADFNGQTLTEEELSYKYEIRATPTLQFYRASDASKPREAGRTGFVAPDEFLFVLRYARERGYDQGPYEDWVRARRNPA